MIDNRCLWLQDPVLPTDRFYEPEVPALARERWDLCSLLPPITFHQGTLNTCGSCALAKLLMGLARPFQRPSVLFLHWIGRLEERRSVVDGLSLRVLLKAVQRYGWCTEEQFSTSMRNLDQSPPVSAFQAARMHSGLAYARVRNQADQVKACLQNGRPILCGLTRFASYTQASSSGQVPLPSPGEEVVDGHAALITGYSDRDRVYYFCNSYGRGWGKNGCGTLPYTYLHDADLVPSLWMLEHPLADWHPPESS